METDRYSFMAHGALSQRLGHDFRFQVARRHLIPDRVVAVRDNEKGKARILFIEMDCSTEPIWSSRTNRKSIARSVGQYRELVGKGLYRTEFGTQMEALVLTVTTSRSRMERMVDEVEKAATNGANNYMLFRTLELDASISKPPQPMHELAAGKWRRAGLAAKRIMMDTQANAPKGKH